MWIHFERRATQTYLLLLEPAFYPRPQLLSADYDEQQRRSRARADNAESAGLSHPHKHRRSARAMIANQCARPAGLTTHTLGVISAGRRQIECE